MSGSARLGLVLRKEDPVARDEFELQNEVRTVPINLTRRTDGRAIFRKRRSLAQLLEGPFSASSQMVVGTNASRSAARNERSFLGERFIMRIIRSHTQQYLNNHPLASGPILNGRWRNRTALGDRNPA
jgi:hypothetical protein